MTEEEQPKLHRFFIDYGSDTIIAPDRDTAYDIANQDHALGDSVSIVDVVDDGEAEDEEASQLHLKGEEGKDWGVHGDPYYCKCGEKLDFADEELESNSQIVTVFCPRCRERYQIVYRAAYWKRLPRTCDYPDCNKKAIAYVMMNSDADEHDKTFLCEDHIWSKTDYVVLDIDTNEEFDRWGELQVKEVKTENE